MVSGSFVRQDPAPLDPVGDPCPEADRPVAPGTPAPPTAPRRVTRRGWLLALPGAAVLLPWMYVLTVHANSAAVNFGWCHGDPAGPGRRVGQCAAPRLDTVTRLVVDPRRGVLRVAHCGNGRSWGPALRRAGSDRRTDRDRRGGHRTPRAEGRSGSCRHGHRRCRRPWPGAAHACQLPPIRAARST